MYGGGGGGGGGGGMIPVHNSGGPMGGGGGGGGGGPVTELCQIYVPNSAVGAIIGAGGSIIKQIMMDSSAHVTVGLHPPLLSRNGATIGAGGSCTPTFLKC